MSKSSFLAIPMSIDEEDASATGGEVTQLLRLKQRICRKMNIQVSKARRTGAKMNRLVGALMALTRTGPARPNSRFYGLLQWAGVLESDPRLAKNIPRLERLPWGSEKLMAPQPDRPPGITGMWPQEPVLHPDMYPSVLHLDRVENVEHVRTNALRYLGQTITIVPGAAVRAALRPRVRALDDEQFARILTETSLAQHIRHTLDAGDRTSFGAVIDGPIEGFSRIDFTEVQAGATLPNIHLEPTTTLLYQRSDQSYAVRAIRVGSRVVTPEDAFAWTLARYQVLSGANIQQTIIVHPRLHFPGDVINALTKTLLGSEHVVARLILPHTHMSLGLDRAVTHHRRSVFCNSPQEIYTSFPMDVDGLCAAMGTGRRGKKDNDGYPSYNFWGTGHDTRTKYGRYNYDWQQAFERFCVEITRDVCELDFDVIQWADAINTWVPGFPAGHEILQHHTLGRAIARYLATVTVQHSCDHYSYAAIPLEHLPMRIRVPFPQEGDAAIMQLQELVSREDFFRHILTHKMFFKPEVAESLHEVRYDFTDSSAKQAVNNFRREWLRLDEHWKGHGFPASYEIASSIQY